MNSFYRFDESRIFKGQISDQEARGIAEELLVLYFERAIAQRQEISVRTTFAGGMRDEFYCVVDSKRRVNLASITEQLLDTPQGRFYATYLLWIDG